MGKVQYECQIISRIINKLQTLTRDALFLEIKDYCTQRDKALVWVTRHFFPRSQGFKCASFTNNFLLFWLLQKSKINRNFMHFCLKYNCNIINDVKIDQKWKRNGLKCSKNGSKQIRIKQKLVINGLCVKSNTCLIL